MKPHTSLLFGCSSLLVMTAEGGGTVDRFELVTTAVVTVLLAYIGDRRVHRIRNKSSVARTKADMAEIERPLHRECKPAEDPYPK